MRRGAALLVVLSTLGCGSPEPAPTPTPPDPCPRLRAAYDAARSTPCATDADCVPAPGIATHRTAPSGHYSVSDGMDGDACASASRRDALASVEAAAQAFAAAGCGEVVPVGDCNLRTTHGRDRPPLCRQDQHVCAAVY